MSNKIKSIVFTLLVVIFVSGCSKTVDIELASEVTMYPSQSSKERIIITEQDEDYVMLNKWLTEHKSGWFTASGRFQGGVYFRSGEHGIQVTKTKVIVYSTKGSKPQALYAQEIKKGDFNKLLNKYQ
ncbi:hypothetical protein [Thalassotalea sp. PLHSN55]|uniref:hypothetical protein n=1 Tax=Thalassotalea sp. PLHSN55 TaxID=3435888 RepID=UPI003F841712